MLKYSKKLIIFKKKDWRYQKMYSTLLIKDSVSMVITGEYSLKGVDAINN